jgi:hypothetical protein
VHQGSGGTQHNFNILLTGGPQPVFKAALLRTRSGESNPPTGSRASATTAETPVLPAIDNRFFRLNLYFPLEFCRAVGPFGRRAFLPAAGDTDESLRRRTRNGSVVRFPGRVGPKSGYRDAKQMSEKGLIS